MISMFPFDSNCTIIIHDRHSSTIDVDNSHISSSSIVFSGVSVTLSLVLCALFVDRCLSFCTFFNHCVVCPSIYGFWPLCHLQALLIGNAQNRT